MPQEDIPNYDEGPREHHPSDISSISSGSSGRISRVYSFSSQTAGSDNESRNGEQSSIENRFEREIEREVRRHAGPVTYQPIVIPAEPSLKELLEQVAGTTALHTVTDIQLRVMSHMLSLQRIPMFCPSLRALNLDGSVVLSLRDLGTDLRNLVHLNVSRCGLKNLDGISGIVNLQELIADGNQISDAGPCTNLPKIQKISLKRNAIESVGSVSFLAFCDTLTSLDLSDNSVTKVTNYRGGVKDNIPQLVMLDGVPFSPDQVVQGDLSSSEYKSTSSDDASKNNNLRELAVLPPPSDSLWVTPERPSTSGGEGATGGNNGGYGDNIAVNNSGVLNRPATADSSTKPRLKISSGEPIVGNVLSHFRRNRKARLAWADSTAEEASDTPTETEHETEKPKAPKEFPIRMPLEPIDLELGIVCQQPREELNDENVLEVARKWRRRIQQTRERIKSADLNRLSSVESDD